MRKFVLIILAILLAVICFLTIGFGVKIGPLSIYSYAEIENSNKERKELLAELKNKNLNEFETTKKDLLDVAKKYQTKKTEYDKLVEKGEITTESIYNSNLYDVDFLLTTIGNYATQNGVNLQFDILRSSTSTSISSEYIICNLSFTVTGEYIPITQFIYNIEDDDTLKFEISDFVMEKGGENLQAVFLVKNVPINNKNLSSIPASSATNLNNN